MDEKSLKTSRTQRIIIGAIAVLLFMSTVAVYALVVLGGQAEKKSSEEDQAKLAEYEAKLTEAQEELTAKEKELSDKYYETFSKYRSRVKAYNATTVDNGGIKTEDLVVGTGDKITNAETYLTYYIGWCADESVFDSSFDSYEKPTKIAPLTHSNESSFIAGWEEGVEGMKVGGIREIAIPGELAYGETQEICGGKNSPLKFLVYAIPKNEEYQNLVSKYNTLYQEYVALYYSTNAVGN